MMPTTLSEALKVEIRFGKKDMPRKRSSTSLIPMLSSRVWISRFTVRLPSCRSVNVGRLHTCEIAFSTARNWSAFCAHIASVAHRPWLFTRILSRWRSGISSWNTCSMRSSTSSCTFSIVSLRMRFCWNSLSTSSNVDCKKSPESKSSSSKRNTSARSGNSTHRSISGFTFLKFSKKVIDALCIAAATGSVFLLAFASRSPTWFRFEKGLSAASAFTASPMLLSRICAPSDPFLRLLRNEPLRRSAITRDTRVSRRSLPEKVKILMIVDLSRATSSTSASVHPSVGSSLRGSSSGNSGASSWRISASDE
eukprot:comp20761_c0_seq1/m.42751 comp20761_c0_seq1/g.42751  ORF comp20761_c0_seq1/g.42751 comp20761_c0_seq1/m.42751 type:complete len:309 (+) comp20761_c0_seq1:890-1816(+)